MIKREGYISIYALLVMSILMIITSYLVYESKVEYHISINTRNNLQSYYLAEGKIYMILFDKYYDEEFYPFVVEVFRGKRTTTKDIILDNRDIDEFESPSKVKLTLRENNNRMEFNLSSESDYKGIKTNITASGTLVNDFFELGSPILSPSTLENSTEDFHMLLNRIFEEINIDFKDLPSNTYGGQFSNFQSLILNQIDENNSYLYAYRETMVEPYIEHIGNNNIVLIIRKYGENDVDLILGNEEGLDSPMELNGLIFVEGNITVFNKFNFNGIIILRDGDIIVKSNEKPKINGLIISSKDLNEDSIDVSYNSENIYRYGLYIPGFIEPNILLFKSN
ncbi:MAG: hypothetical protein GX077_06250 [Tissierellia bacterium]|nr:hypothetical protein [Tissierellia bacterium]